MTPPFREYQQRMIEAGVRLWFDRKMGGYMLGADMGLGKTLCIAEILETLMFDCFEVERVIISAPKRVAYEAIPNEFEKWGYRRLQKVLRVFTHEDFGLERDTDRTLKSHPDCIKRLRKEIKGAGRFIHIVSRDHLHQYLKAAGPSFEWDLAVWDESTSFSNPKANRYKAARKIGNRTNKVLLSTGTPIPDKLEQLAAQMFLIDGGKRLFRTLRDFRREYMEPDFTSNDIVHSWRPLPGSVDRIVREVSDRVMILRSEDWLELPERLVVPVEVDLPPEARADYEAMFNDLTLEFEDAEVFAANAGVRHGKLQQIANGIVFETNEFETPRPIQIHRAKLDALLEIHEAHPAPLLIWYSHTPDRDAILKEVPGAVCVSKVKHLERDWNAGKISRLVAHGASIGHGMNLQHCPGADEVWYGLPPSNEVYRQAMKRLYRSGRKRSLRSFMIVARRTVEQKIVRRLERNEGIQSAFREGILEEWGRHGY